MAKYRQVHTTFWQDPKILEEMTPEDKYFYLYLLTNPNTTQIGVYQITKKQMAFDLGYSTESINSLLDRFINNHGVIKYNESTRELAIINWGKYNLHKAGKPVIDCVKKELKEVKDLSLLPFISEKIKNQDVKNLYDSYAKNEGLYFEPSKRYKPTNIEKITTNNYVLWRDRQTCFYTGLVLQKEDIQIDHISPRVDGGSGNPGNLVVCYSKFNNLKSGRSELNEVISEWNEKNPGLIVNASVVAHKIESLKEFEKLRYDSGITYRETIENGIYDTYTLRNFLNTTRGQEEEKEKEEEVEEEKEQQEENVYHFYQENFGVLNPFISEKLTMWVDDVGIELVIESMKRALANQKKFNYAEGILKRWQNENIKTLADVQALDNQFNNKGSVQNGVVQKDQYSSLF
jgi:DnaD/phage-associated family protein